MLDAANTITRHISSRNRDDLEHDELFALALVHLIQIIGEASRLGSTMTKEAHPEVSWNRIQAMRHRIVHNYTDIDFDIVWDVITESIPELVPAVERILDEMDGEQGSSPRDFCPTRHQIGSTISLGRHKGSPYRGVCPKT